jgi:hypothetical protein
VITPVVVAQQLGGCKVGLPAALRGCACRRGRSGREPGMRQAASRQLVIVSLHAD